MAFQRENEYFNADLSDNTDLEDGYDSEAAEVSKGERRSAQERSVKRRRITPSEDYDGVLPVDATVEQRDHHSVSLFNGEQASGQTTDSLDAINKKQTTPDSLHNDQAARSHLPLEIKPGEKLKRKESKPGVVYLSSVPPYLKPSALRNLLMQRGFSPITRLFLTPSSKAKSNSKKNSRQLYTEGWIEFASKKTARRCAEDLNAHIIGGKKGGFYHDDLWNMKYLRGMSWNELMAGIREEKREEEGRRDEERRTIARETEMFIEGVEQGKRLQGMKRKMKQRGGDAEFDDRASHGGDTARTWRQFETKSKKKDVSADHKEVELGEDVKEVLGKIF